MRFSTLIPAVAGLMGVAQAHLPGTLGNIPDVAKVADVVKTPDVSKSVSHEKSCSLAKSWENKKLFKGVAGPKTDKVDAINLDLNLKQAQVEGEVSLQALGSFLQKPTIRLDLATIKAYVEIDLSADAAIFHTVELFASAELKVDAEIAEVDLAAAFALDLIVGCGAAIDISAGFWVSFGEGDYVDIDIISKEIDESKIEGLHAKALPVEVGVEVDLAAAIELTLGLRLRSQIKVEAEIEIGEIDVLDAGAEISIWADLCHYTITLIKTDTCAVYITNEFGLSLGIEVDVNAKALDVLNLSLAPSVVVTLAKGVKGELCLPGRAQTTPGTTPTPRVTASLSLVKPITDTKNGLVTSTTTTTNVYTVTSCHASVPNCPASQTQVIVTSTVESTVTVCPMSGSTFATSKTAAPKPVPTITEGNTPVAPCEPTSSTFTPAPGAPQSVQPTVTMTNSQVFTPTPGAGTPTAGTPGSAPSVTGTPGSGPSVTGTPGSGPSVTGTPGAGPSVTGAPSNPPVQSQSWAPINTPPAGSPVPPINTPPAANTPVQSQSSWAPINTPPAVSAPVAPIYTPAPVVPNPPIQAPPLAGPGWPNGSNNTIISSVKPAPSPSNWVPPPPVSSGSAPISSDHPTSGAEAVKVGLAMIVPAVAVIFF